MAIQYHPEVGTIVVCDFRGFEAPEMVKRRPAIVVSPRFRNRGGLCTIVPLSTTPPRPVMAYHHQLRIDEPLPAPYNSAVQWVKADMFCTVSFSRLFLPHNGRDGDGKRQYVVKVIDAEDLKRVKECMLHAMGFPDLTGYL